MSNWNGEKDDKTLPVHLLIFPFPSSGHIIPLLDLTRRLLTHYNHHHLTVTVTVTVTPPSLSLLQPLLDSFPPSQLQPLILSPPLPSSSASITSTIRGIHVLSDPIISWFRSHPSPPHALISDFLLAWTHSLSTTLALPRVVFYTSGAFASSVFYSMWRSAPQIPQGDNPDFEVRFDEVPGSPRFKWSELPHQFRSGKADDPDWELYRSEMLTNLTSWGAVFNSFSELESVYLNHFKKEMGHDRVWAVGPLLPDDEDPDAAHRGGTSSLPAQEVLTWLDGKPDSSVVYVCFGSRTSPTAEQSEVLGAALECSGVHFVWCTSKSDDGNGITPDSDYEDRVAGKGLIIRGWAPQLAILRHRAVATFLTHCGWNSVLESISVGVMMLAWPMGADQYWDSHLVVDQLGLGLQVQCNGPNGVPNPGELAQLLVDSVSPHLPERARVMRLQEAAATTVNGGSSAADLDKLVRSLSELK